MKVTTIIRTEWLIARVMRQLRSISGIRQIYQEQQTPRLVSVVATLSNDDRYEFYFSRYSGRCGVIKIYRRHPYTEVIKLPDNPSDALNFIKKESLCNAKFD